ncbi:MAG: hypothetical protein ACR2LV_07390 [Solirubrobacteraceae bacterium]
MRRSRAEQIGGQHAQPDRGNANADDRQRSDAAGACVQALAECRRVQRPRDCDSAEAPTRDTGFGPRSQPDPNGLPPQPAAVDPPHQRTSGHPRLPRGATNPPAPRASPRPMPSAGLPVERDHATGGEAFVVRTLGRTLQCVLESP